MRTSGKCAHNMKFWAKLKNTFVPIFLQPSAPQLPPPPPSPKKKGSELLDPIGFGRLIQNSQIMTKDLSKVWRNYFRILKDTFWSDRILQTFNFSLDQTNLLQLLIIKFSGSLRPGIPEFQTAILEQ